MTSEQVVQLARDAGVRLIRFLYCDNGGVIRGKLTHIDGLAGRIIGGMGLTVAMQAFNMLDALVPFEGMGPVGEVRIVPDPSSFKVLPYAPRAAGMVADLLTHDGQPWSACPRSFLKRMTARATAHGILVQASLENEFILTRGSPEAGGVAPIDDAPCFSTIAMQESAAVVDDMVTTFEAMGMAIDLYYPEYGPARADASPRRRSHRGR
jgi:glutamine synthetase